MNIMNKIILNAKGLALTLLGALIADALSIPLPWLLGPLIASLFLGALGKPIACDSRWRICGQIIIGMALGLYFTPNLLTALTTYGHFIVLGLVWSMMLGLLLAWLQFKINHVDWSTAWFSSAIGSASEMVNIAEQYHAQVDKVVAAHSLRLLLLVLIVPFFMTLYFSVDLSQMITKQEASYDVEMMLGLFILAIIVGKVFNHFHVLNAWLLGPLCLIAGLALTSTLNLKFPSWFIYFGQLCIGWSLASKFPFDFLKNNREFIWKTVLFNLFALMLTLILVEFLAIFSDTDQKILLLGLAPGGIAEMSLTAKALGLAVPVVVAFQLSRLIFVIITTRYLYQLTCRVIFQEDISSK